jgi:hypothetical protein
LETISNQKAQCGLVDKGGEMYGMDGKSQTEYFPRSVLDRDDIEPSQDDAEEAVEESNL